MTDNLTAQIEALLYYYSEPITLDTLAETCNAEPEAVKQAVHTLKSALEDRGLALVQHDSQVELRTDPEFDEIITKLHKTEVNTNLTEAQSEALAVIAYMEPITKPDIDFIRGVNSRTVLRNLKTRGLIQKQQGNTKDTYSLTTEALSHLGITEPQDLPKYESTQQKLAEFVSAAETESETDN